ncbi:E1 ubiquitin-activating protein uba2 [Scheffersomyces spartinae]|uniref:Ubiquitin-activating enzyme E1-like n=1 Tax=Scheffersomyces spartinae TaxID=45513 RepID=A0A9P7VE90_9ASCO|nr:E1 ubiquitin-activating protein uba2 [Scheffersomyces spartinae]KAG7196224.1 E1 ubiquitin-activating protein uba2 [Scheffersomyces spartinae]
MGRETYLKKIYGEEAYKNLKSKTILMVGAGGIGCELIKDLMLSGYSSIHIVDLDTITLSNLNRQFLFRQKDIDQSKSKTICEAVQSFNYFDCKLTSQHGNIMDTKQFPISWWRQFDMIYNALDNLEARRFVNQMCLFLGKPLIESGTTGYQGQVQPIFPYLSECFECQAKVTPKTFPVCTIRSTPSQPVHCITWAKDFLFVQLFDDSTAATGSELSHVTNQDSQDNDELETLKKELSELQGLRNLFESGNKELASILVEDIFVKDIARLLRIDALWKLRAKPIPLEYNKEDLEKLLMDNKSLEILSNDTQMWSVVENVYVLYKSLQALQDRYKVDPKIPISFDKDDEDTLNFVVSSANLRSHVFGIEIKSKFDIKQIAGNIIPAIATTNSIISGFSSLAGIRAQIGDKIDISKHLTTYISIKPNKYITSASLVPPNHKCASCSLVRKGIARCSIGTTKLSQLLQLVCKRYGYVEDATSIIIGKSKLVYDMDFDDNLETSLEDLGVFNGQVILIQDDDDNLENLELLIEDKKGEAILPNIQLRKKTTIITAEPGGLNDINDDHLKTVESENGDTMIVIDEDDESEIEEMTIDTDGVHAISSKNGDGKVDESFLDDVIEIEDLDDYGPATKKQRLH